MKTWTIANQKGGVGKTTTAITLAGILSERGHNVLLIDTDPHASLTYYLGVDAESLDITTYDLFLAGRAVKRDMVEQARLHTPFEGIDLLPATMALATLDRKFGQQEGMGLVLRRALSLVKDQYDYALIDCPPVLGVLMVNALAACDRILIPVQTEFLALKGLERMVRTMEIMQRSCDNTFRSTIVPTMYDKRTRASLQALEHLKHKYPDAVWNGAIPTDTKFRDSSLHHRPPSIHTPHSRGVVAYKTLLSYLQQVTSDTQDEA
ncbi:ParA family protein [Corallincola platygyrae]|uniref:ParA family protein n=1 Tax=Corallincola platygyrae TaxID=1193278 RepID=A0ABW4XIF1_9GAMM